MSWMGEQGRKFFTETAKHSLVPEADPKVNEESQWVVRSVILPLRSEHAERRCHLKLLYDNRHHLDMSCPAPIPKVQNSRSDQMLQQVLAMCPIPSLQAP